MCWISIMDMGHLKQCSQMKTSKLTQIAGVPTQRVDKSSGKLPVNGSGIFGSRSDMPCRDCQCAKWSGPPRWKIQHTCWCQNASLKNTARGNWRKAGDGHVVVSELMPSLSRRMECCNVPQENYSG